MNLTDQNRREKDFHNELQSQPKGRFENIFYKAIFNSNEDFFIYDSSVTKKNTKNIFKNFLFFKKPPFFLKIFKNNILKFYYLIEHRYKGN